MKKIEAVIRPEKLSAVRRALGKTGHAGLMVTEIEGHGKQKGVTHQFRGEDFKVELLPKIRVELVVPDAEVERIVQTITESARTGEIGDGKIFVYDIADAIRIRTGEKGEMVV